MRESKQFNCVGAALIGHHLMSKAKIKNMIANPFGHIANVIELSDGNYLYADFLNDIVKKIEPEVKKTGKLEVLEINDDLVEYRKILVYDDIEIPSSIVGNLRSLINEAVDPEKTSDDLEKKEALLFFGQFKEELASLDLDKIEAVLYKDIVEFDQSDEMKIESERIRKIHHLFEEFHEAMKIELPVNELTQVKKYFRKNPHEAKRYILSGDKKDFEKLPKNVQIYIQACKKWLEELRQKDSEMFQEMATRINTFDSILRVEISN